MHYITALAQLSFHLISCDFISDENLEENFEEEVLGNLFNYCYAAFYTLKRAVVDYSARKKKLF